MLRLEQTCPQRLSKAKKSMDIYAYKSAGINRVEQAFMHFDFMNAAGEYGAEQAFMPAVKLRELWL